MIGFCCADGHVKNATEAAVTSMVLMFDGISGGGRRDSSRDGQVHRERRAKT